MATRIFHEVYDRNDLLYKGFDQDEALKALNEGQAKAVADGRSVDDVSHGSVYRDA